MKLIVSALVLLATQSAFALKTAEVFKGITNTTPRCYGREYTAADMAKHPQQTVEQIKVKMVNWTKDPKSTITGYGLQVELRLKGERNVNYTQGMSCFDLGGEIQCGVECDGGHVILSKIDKATMTIKNNGVTISGGCGEGEEEKTKFLESIKGADDIFLLSALPTRYCGNSDVPAY